MDKIYKCFICKKDFKSRWGSYKYCGRECRIKGGNLLTKNYFKKKIKGGDNTSYLLLRFKIFKRDNFQCQYCGRNVIDDKIKLHIDHITPKSKGGNNEYDNLITSCEECNLGKMDLLLDERQIKRLKEKLKKRGVKLKLVKSS